MGPGPLGRGAQPRQRIFGDGDERIARRLRGKADQRVALAQRLEPVADARGEVTVDVTSAQALTQDQQTRLINTLHGKTGKTVKLNTRVDESLIGGMIVKLGSQMIDSSIRSKLASLQNAMKEVG